MSTTIDLANVQTHVLLYGPHGPEQINHMRAYLHTLYGSDTSCVLIVNCMHESPTTYLPKLKHMVKTTGQPIYPFKSIVLLHADYMSQDTQASLRRCIELYSHTTRFFLLVHYIHKLMAPMISRCCCLYVGGPPPLCSTSKPPILLSSFLKEMTRHAGPTRLTRTEIMVLSHRWYLAGYTACDILFILEHRVDWLPPTLCALLPSEAAWVDLLFRGYRMASLVRNESLVFAYVLFALVHP